jgi:mandelate racemase
VTPPKLTIREVRVRAVNVPLTEPVKTASGEILTAPLVLLDVLTEEGINGTSYVFCYTPDALKPIAQAATNIGAAIAGDAVVPFELDLKLRQKFRLLGVQGLMTMAMAGIDMAAWDALARAAEMPLVSLLGGAPKPIPAYASCGMLDATEAAKAAEKVAKAGFQAMKVKIGHADVATDLAVIRAVRNAAGDAMAIMVDYNQSLWVTEAIARTRELDEEGLHWIEEPTVAEDFEGHAAIADETATPIQMGENWWGVADMAKSVAAGASDLAMIDVMKIGGVTGWLKAAALAEANGLPVSSHLFPEISGHLLAVTPTCHWLELLDVAAEVLLDPVTIRDGDFVFPETPGTGIEWDEKAVGRHEV